MEDGEKHTITIEFNDQTPSSDGSMMELKEAFWNQNMQSWQGKLNDKNVFVPIYNVVFARYED